MNKTIISIMLTLMALTGMSCQKHDEPDNKTTYASCPFKVKVNCTDNGKAQQWGVTADGRTTSPDGKEGRIFVSSYEKVVMSVESDNPGFVGVEVKSSDPQLIAVTKSSSREYVITGAKDKFGSSTIEVSNGSGADIRKTTFKLYQRPEPAALVFAIKETGDSVYAYGQENGKTIFYLTEQMRKFGREYKEVSISSQHVESVEEKDKAIEVKFSHDESVSLPLKKARFVAPEEIVLRGWKDFEAELPWEINMSLPEVEPLFTVDGDFFALSGEHAVVTRSDNRGSRQEGTVTIYDRKGRVVTAVVRVVQLPLAPENAVAFKDFALEKVMLEKADSDGDGYVTFDEALTVETVDAVGKGIRDLAGLEHFKKVWKLDLRDNDISDGTCLRELPLLYWLDLKGNHNLRTFDVTGCSEYFEHCAFEVSEGFTYYGYTHQIGLGADSDPYLKYRSFVHDERETTNWSHHKKMVKVRTHTKTMTREEFPWLKKEQDGMVPTIVFSGLSYIDVDFQDGSWKRLMDETCKAYMECSPIVQQWGEYFDVYYMQYEVSNRERYYYEGIDYTDPTTKAAIQLRRREENVYYLDAYDCIFGDTDCKVMSVNMEPPIPTKQYPAQLVVSMNCDIAGFIEKWDNEIIYESHNDQFGDYLSGNGTSLQYREIYYLDSERACMTSPENLTYITGGESDITGLIKRLNFHKENYFLKLAGFLNKE